MGYAILACLVEENYLHNVRRAINDIKMNIEETKPKIMNNINHLIRYDRNKLNKKMFEDFKFSLNKIKVRMGDWNYWSWYLRIDPDHYLYDILAPMLEYSRNRENIVETKKHWLKKAKKFIEDHCSYKETAEWLSHHSGRTITGMGLREVLKRVINKGW